MSGALKWSDRLEMLIPGLPGDHTRRRGDGDSPVVLLHGLWRGKRAMEPMARVLANEGFTIWNIPYPSTRYTIPELAKHVSREVEKIPRHEPLHFVTHSLGCVILRALLAEKQPWDFGKLVMLAPPNGGSEIVDWTRRHLLLHQLLGPAGRSLGSDGITKALPPPPKGTDLAVIMGNRPAIPFFRKLLEPENDGIVSVSRGKLPGIREFAVVDADHTFIQIHPETLRLTLAFLRQGSFQT